MTRNRYYTVLIVPEKSSRLRKFFVPIWLIRAGALIFTVLGILIGLMIFDYWYVLSQLGENRQLKLENRKLKQQVQVFENKVSTVEATLDRVKTFATRLRVIMHLEEDPSQLTPELNLSHSEIKLEETPLLEPPSVVHSPVPPVMGPSPTTSPSAFHSDNLSGPAEQFFLIEGLKNQTDPEILKLQRDYLRLESRLASLNQDAFRVEEVLQDEYEILFDKRSFLEALPTRQPASGYFTSGFGIRASPYGGRYKMHEGLDIANRVGTIVRAPAKGEVIFADAKAGYGTTIVVNHGYGIETWYGHLKKCLVKKGTLVHRGTQLALMGNTGRSTGPHVHYEVRVRGFPVDPRSYIFEDSSP